jgi:hypothetical protein
MHGEEAMHRIEWRLLHPIREGARETVEALSAELSDLEAYQAPGHPTNEARIQQLADEVAALTIPPCEAVGAPRVGDSADCEQRLVVEFHEDDLIEEALDFSEYAALRKQDYDCERCPYGTPYTRYPLSPCEFAAGAFLDLVEDDDLLDRILAEMEPPEMEDLASTLEALRRSGNLPSVEGVDSADYFAKAALFLRFWARLGFSVAPWLAEHDEEGEDDDVIDADDAEPDAVPARQRKR